MNVISTESKSKYHIDFTSPTIDDFSSLRRKAGWGEIDIDMARNSLAHSLFHVAVYDLSVLVGMGRVVGDGFMYFYIQDVIVDSDYQGQGIGHILMTKIECYLLEVAKKGSTIGLLAAKGKEGFYTRYDYVQRPNNALGNGMCKFI